jgi:hypothetical protein
LAASSFAVAFPIPELAPVIRMVLPESEEGGMGRGS